MPRSSTTSPTERQAKPLLNFGFIFTGPVHACGVDCFPSEGGRATPGEGEVDGSGRMEVEGNGHRSR